MTSWLVSMEQSAALVVLGASAGRGVSPQALRTDICAADNSVIGNRCGFTLSDLAGDGMRASVQIACKSSAF